MYLIWCKLPPREDEHLHKNTLYLFRIFIIYNKKNLDEEDLLKIRGNIEFLCANLEDLNAKKSRLKYPKDIQFHNLLSGEVFSEIKDRYSKSILDESINFTFPTSLPLPRLPILKHDNVRYIDLDDKFIDDAIPLGYHLKDGVITTHITYIPINKFSQDCVIFGKSGSGKTYFLANLVHEFYKKTKDRRLGILILNVAKENQEIFYQDFLILKYSDADFKIPYFFSDDTNKLEKHLQETATYICASLGLKNVFEKIIYRSMVGIIRLEGHLPKNFYELLELVENYMNINSYGPEEQANLMQAFRNRKNVFEEEKIQDVLNLSEEIPEWLNDWMNGKNIYLDLSVCSKFIKLLVVNAIFQLIRVITKDIESDELRNLIIIDEAHVILEKPITNNSDDADFIMKEQMSKIFSELLKEYRSRGVGFIIVDQSPERLFEDVSSQPSIKFLLRLDYPNNLLFSEDPEERQMLSQLENRLLLVNNGTTGEKFLLKTPNLYKSNY
ncbi:MAG: ATP-binding protein [Candidatus Lokiarchaeota archaeon]|nr:ATP-binding protein [Candidatus Lokiarchaeota archaeon]